MTSASAASGIVAQGMRKSFDDHLVLDKVSLAVEEGTILALLGHNGAGKPVAGSRHSLPPGRGRPPNGQDRAYRCCRLCTVGRLV